MYLIQRRNRRLRKLEEEWVLKMQLEVLRNLQEESYRFYSSKVELIEYKMMMNTMANSWMYKEEYQEVVNENHNAPIIDREILSPYIQRYTYTFNNVFLAESYLNNQWDYLNNLN